MMDLHGYAQAAPLYRRLGWAQVIPLPEGRKTPPPSGVTGRNAQPVTDRQIQEWSHANPEGNVALVIPATMIVLDIDAPEGHEVKADGTRNIRKLEAELGALPATWTSTAHGRDSKARHMWYQVPAGLRFRGGAIEGVDILQPGHRYSVVWPSIHPTGEIYQWYSPNGMPADPPTPDRIPMLPKAWLDRLIRKDNPQREMQRQMMVAQAWSRQQYGNAGMCRRVRQQLQKIVDEPAAKGSRHDTMMQGAWALIKLMEEGHRGALDALSQLKPLFVREVAEERGGERIAENEFNRIVQGALDKNSGVQGISDPCDERTADRMGMDEYTDTINAVSMSTQPVGNGLQTSPAANVEPAPVSSVPARSTDITPRTVPQSNPPTPGFIQFPSSWAFEDLTDLAAGIELPPTPTVFEREDGQGLLYRGVVNDVHGEPGCGKSLIMQIACAQELRKGNEVVYVDYEDTARNVVKRLLLMGVKGDAIRERLHYVRPSAKPTARTSMNGWEQTLDYAQYSTLAIIDGVTSCFSYEGVDSNSGDDIAAWYNRYPREIARLDPAVALIDHVTKSKDNRGRFASGSMQKLALIDGISYSVDMTKPVGKGLRGTIVLKSGKDRISEIEEHCASTWSGKSHLREAARVEIDSTHENMMRVSICRPNMMPTNDSGTAAGFRPTGLMEKISMLVEQSPEPSTQSDLIDGLKADGSGARRQTMLKALRLLLEEGYLDKQSGRYNTTQYSIRRPYRQADDPRSDAYQDRMRMDEADELNATGQGVLDDDEPDF